MTDHRDEERARANTKASFSDPETHLIAFKKKEKQKKDTKIKSRSRSGRGRSRGSEWTIAGVKGPRRYPHARADPSPRVGGGSSPMTWTRWNTCLFLAYLEWCMLVRVFVFTNSNVGKIHVFTVNRGSRRWKQRKREVRNGILLIQYLLIKQNYFP